MGAKTTNVIIVNVSAILSKMNRDAISATKVCLDSGPDWVRIKAAASLSKRRHMVDIDPQFNHAKTPFFKTDRYLKSEPVPA
jgi:hypothetical protein